MIISINTDILKELSTLAMNISSEITSAYSCLTPVVEHNDWNCAERDLVNDNINALKKHGNKVKEYAEIFSSTLQKTSNQFDDFEKKTPDALQAVHTSLSDALSVYTPVKTPTSTLTKYLDGRIDLKNKCGYTIYQVGELENPIKVLKFSDEERKARLLWKTEPIDYKNLKFELK